MSKLVFLHSSVLKETILVNSFTDDCLVRTVSEDSTIEELTNGIDVTGLNNIAFVWHYPGYCRLPFFYDEGTDEVETPSHIYFSKHIVEFMKSLPDGCKVDLLSCNLNTSHFMDEVQTLENECGVDIRYSLDQTGNDPDGNWVLESDNVNIKAVYFKTSIATWSGILSQAITPYDIANTNTDSFSYANNVLTLKKNIVWSQLTNVAANDYIQLQNTDTFDGQGYTIDLTGITNWDGLFECNGGTATDRAKIKNLGVLNGTLQANGGFIIKPYQKFFEIDGCYSTGDINVDDAGGICGMQAGYQGNCIVSNCYSTGNISGGNTGGICGNQAGFSGGTCTVTNCFSTGTITTQYGAGIIGRIAQNCTVSNCYSTGNIMGTYAGGIFGGGSNNSTANNCYAAGDISGNHAGGIFGSSFSGVINRIVNNCYSKQQPIQSDGPSIKQIHGNYNINLLEGGDLDASLNIHVNSNVTNAFVADNFGDATEYPLLKSFRENAPWNGIVSIMLNGVLTKIEYNNFDLYGDYAVYNPQDNNNVSTEDNIPVGTTIGDPFVKPMYGDLYELPMKKTVFRLVQGDDLIINASTRKITGKEGKQIKKFYKAMYHKECPNHIITKGVFYKKVYIKSECNTFEIDFDTMSATYSEDYFITSVELKPKYCSITKASVKNIIVNIAFTHSKYGKTILKLRVVDNPQVKYAIDFSTEKVLDIKGLLVREYKSSSMECEALQSTKKCKGIMGKNKVLSILA